MLPGLEAAELPADAIEVGRITDAWGIKGWFKVLSHSPDPEALYSSKRWYLLPPDRGAQPFSGCALLRVREAKDHSGTVVASAHDIDDRSAAELLRHARVFIARSSFPSTQSDEYYWVDLLGLNVVNREAIALGQVKDLMSTGPQTVLVLGFEAPDDAGVPQAQERLIPFVSAYVDKVDLAAKLITVDWQPDY